MEIGNTIRDEFLIEYCIVIVALNYFGLSTNQISFMLDLR